MVASYNFDDIDRSNTGSLKWQHYPANVLPMWVADMDYSTAPPILEALHERINHGVFGYTLPSQELIETCCQYFARRWDWRINEEWLVMSPGLGVSIHTATRYLGDLSKSILIPQPIYHVFRNAPIRAKRNSINIPFTRAGDGWELDPELLVELADKQGGASVLMLCNPHNPNGKVFTKTELETLAQLAIEHDWIICSDEVHADLILEDDLTHIPIASLGPEVSKRTVTMQSPSKAFNIAGLNFAVCVIEDEKLRETYRYGAQGQVVSQLNPMGMIAGKIAWSGQCDDWLKASNNHLKNNRNMLFNAVKDIQGITMLPLPSTYLAWLDISELNLPDPATHFEDHGLGLSPGNVFGCDKHMRLNFGCSKDTLQQGINLLIKAVS